MRFRPKIGDIMQDYGMDPVLLIPKNGGLKSTVAKTLMDMGVDYLNFERVDSDNYTDGNLKVQIYRGEDIPQVIEDLYFEQRVKAIGFTGDDLFDEYRLRNPGTIVQLLETIDWDDEEAMFRRPTLRWLARKGEAPKGKIRLAVNRKYEITSRIAAEERKEEFGIEPEIMVYSGNTEQTVADGINDMCIEIVYGGGTIERNRLEIKGMVRFSDFAVIGVNEASPLIFQRDYQMIDDRVRNTMENSYISLLALDPNKAFKKMGEEFAEYLGALKVCETSRGRQRVIEEYADLICFMSLNMAMAEIEFGGITREMYRRLKRK